MFPTIIYFTLTFSMLGKWTASKEKKSREPDIGLFDSDYVSRVEDQMHSWNVYQRQHILSVLGKLALFARLHRAWMKNPRTGQRGTAQYFPRPPVTFHSWIYDDCSVKFLTCIDKIYANIQNRSSVLFPKTGQISDNFTFNEAVFTRSVTNTMFAYDMSVLYLLCFLSMNRLSILRLLPFCTYGTEFNQEKTWYSARFQDAKSRLNIRHGAGVGADPVDHFIGQNDFECAEESFCPDPCCGRLTRRWATSGNFCKQSVCLHNDLDETELLSNETETTILVEPSTYRSLTSKDFFSGAEEAAHACHVDAFFNSDMLAIIENRWNVSCACVRENPESSSTDGHLSFVVDLTRIYRFDVKMCVDVDECLYTSCGRNEECVNVLGSYLCVCKLGYLPFGNSSVCSPIRLDNTPSLANVMSPP